jgi:hypothetical protein
MNSLCLHPALRVPALARFAVRRRAISLRQPGQKKQRPARRSFVVGGVVRNGGVRHG